MGGGIRARDLDADRAEARFDFDSSTIELQARDSSGSAHR
jgi:hypothetical protein